MYFDYLDTMTLLDCIVYMTLGYEVTIENGDGKESRRICGMKLKVGDIVKVVDIDNIGMPRFEPVVNTVVEVRRPAKVGEYVKVVEKDYTSKGYKNGDILRIVGVDNDNAFNEYWAFYKNRTGMYLYESEYVVLENYTPSEEPRYTKEEWLELTQKALLNI